MKICPKCQKTYQDDALNFCLDDGAVLNQVGDTPQTDDSLPETVMISPSRTTAPNQQFGGSSQPGWGQQEQPSQSSQSSQSPWGHQQQSQPSWGANAGNVGQPAAPKSKSWIWVLGILAAVVVICGGGFVGLMVLIANVEPSNKPDDTNIKITNLKTPAPTPNVKFDKVNMSKWTNTNKEFATAEYINGEYILQVKKAGFYYVLVTPPNYKTENAVTRVTMKNVDSSSTALGYGLIFHSNPKPLTQGYAFLIDSEKKRYRVVTHAPQKENEVVKWTNSDSIKGTSSANTLEVRDKNGSVELYINGDLVETVKNTEGYKGGVTGIYAGDAVKISFSDLEVGK